MKTTRKTIWASPDYGLPHRNMPDFAYFGKGAKVYGYYNDEIIYGTCTGNRRGDVHFAEEPEAEIILGDGSTLWINCDAFANVEK